MARGSTDPYGDDVLNRPRGARTPVRTVTAAPGLVVEERTGGFVGDVVAVTRSTVTLRDRRGRRREFPLASQAFLVDGRPATLVAPAPPSRPAGPARTASGSIAGLPQGAQVARASRIYVEGVHDAELLEKVWGDDLREAAIVVEYLEGIDDVERVVSAFGPGPGRRLGVLVDHLVAGSKESRLAATISGPHVRVTGHPFVDVWQAVRPSVLGIAAWPVVDKGQPWKEGVCAALGVGPPPELWRRILAAVDDYRDLEPPLVGAVEQLLDFLTDP